MSLSSGADDLAGLDARGADLELLGRAATGRGAHRLDVRVPAAVGPPVRVGHVVAEARSLATDVAHASHGILLGLKRTELMQELKGAQRASSQATRQGYPMRSPDSQSASAPGRYRENVGGR